MKAVLDTSVLVTGGFAQLPDELAVSAISLAELHYGVLVALEPARRADRLRRLALVERSLEPLPFDDACARSYGVLAAATVAAGRQPRGRAFDLAIAATAHAHSARLYTRNAQDLAGLTGLLDIVAL